MGIRILIFCFFLKDTNKTPHKLQASFGRFLAKCTHLNTFTVYKVTMFTNKSCKDETQNISLLYQNHILHHNNSIVALI